MRTEKSKQNIERILLQRRKNRLLNYLFRRSFLFRLSFIVRISFILFFLGIYFFGSSLKTYLTEEQVIYSDCYTIYGNSMRSISHSRLECLVITDKSHYFLSRSYFEVNEIVFVKKNFFGHPISMSDGNYVFSVSSRFSFFYLFLTLMTCISLIFVDVTIPNLKKIFIAAIVLNITAFLFYITYSFF